MASSPPRSAVTTPLLSVTANTPWLRSIRHLVYSTAHPFQPTAARVAHSERSKHALHPPYVQNQTPFAHSGFHYHRKYSSPHVIDRWLNLTGLVVVSPILPYLSGHCYKTH